MSSLLRKRIAVDALLSLSEEQRERFSDYLSSPYFKLRVEETFYQALLLKIIPDPGELTDEDFFAELFPGAPFNADHLTRQFFPLMEALMDFFAQEQFQRQKLTGQVMALDELQTWRLDGLYTRKHKRVDRNLKPEKLSSERKIRLRIHYLRGVVSFLLSEGVEKMVMVHLEEAYQLQKSVDYLVSLKLYAAMLNRELLSTDKIPEGIVAPSPSEGISEQIPLISMFEHVVSMLQAVLKKDALQAYTSYQQLKALLDREVKNLEDTEASDLYVYALNFCSHYDGRTHGIPGFDPMAEMDRWGSRIMAIGLKVGRLDWRIVYVYVLLLLRLDRKKEFKRIMEKVDGKFVSDPLNNSSKIIKGLIAYGEKDFEEARRFFVQILGENRLDLVNIHGRTMLLRCYYELGDPDLEANSEAFRQYLMRSGGKSSGLSPAKLATFQNFNRLLMKLSNANHDLNENRRRRKLGKLKELVENTNTVAKEWLLRMITEAL